MTEPARRTREARRTTVSARVLPVLLFPLCLATPLSAQAPDFLFGRPNVTLVASVGWSMPGEGSDLFAFTRDNLTVDRGDFSAPLIVAELGARMTERVDVALGLEYSGAVVPSEMRDFVTVDDRPIPQTTEFSHTRLMASLKGYLFSRGRTISQYAWVANTWSPYLGAGVGVTWYAFDQSGDFVDYQTLNIFEEEFRSTGRGFTTHVMGGFDVSLSETLLLRAEYRHIWGRGELDTTVFDGFDDIDLSGSRATLGIGVRI